MQVGGGAEKKGVGEDTHRGQRSKQKVMHILRGGYNIPSDISTLVSLEKKYAEMLWLVTIFCFYF